MMRRFVLGTLTLVVMLTLGVGSAMAAKPTPKLTKLTAAQMNVVSRWQDRLELVMDQAIAGLDVCISRGDASNGCVGAAYAPLRSHVNNFTLKVWVPLGGSGKLSRTSACYQRLKTANSLASDASLAILSIPLDGLTPVNTNLTRFVRAVDTATDYCDPLG